MAAGADGERGAKRVKALVVGAVSFAVSLGAFVGTGLGDRTCRWAAENGLFIPTVCPAEYKPVPLADATQFLDKFIGRAGASAPERAWGMMSAEMRQLTPLDTFQAEWEYDWAERTGDISPAPSFNAFDVTYRTYRGITNQDHDYVADKAKVTYHRQVYVLRYTDAVELATGLPLEVANVRGDIRDVESPIKLVKIRLTEAVRPLERPRIDAQPVGIRVGPGQLSVYCAIDNPSEGQWLRTGLGWVASADTDHGATGVQTTMCDPHHLISP